MESHEYLSQRSSQSLCFPKTGFVSYSVCVCAPCMYACLCACKTINTQMCVSRLQKATDGALHGAEIFQGFFVNMSTPLRVCVCVCVCV